MKIKILKYSAYDFSINRISLTQFNKKSRNRYNKFLVIWDGTMLKRDRTERAEKCGSVHADTYKVDNAIIKFHFQVFHSSIRAGIKCD